MALFNRLTTALFDVLLAPLGHESPWFDLALWPVLGGIAALLVIKAVSNQAGITRTKELIQVHLLEVLLFRDDLRTVFSATAKALGYNLLYLAYNVVPMLVMIVPMTTILVQLVSHYAYTPLRVGESATLIVELDDALARVTPAEVTLDLPDGVVLEAAPVRTADGRVAWRMSARVAGDHVLRVHAGGSVEDKLLSVGGPARKVSVLRTKGWEALLYPAEAVPAAGSPIASITILDRREAPLGPFPAGESGIVAWFFGASLLAGFLLKDRFGVTL
ncbi:MAG: hypothetical protein EXR71_08745 [Myxococcales bacterium]|nr:hypothetical protein [Myxococcales bacterium]